MGHGQSIYMIGCNDHRDVPKTDERSVEPESHRTPVTYNYALATGVRGPDWLTDPQSNPG